MSHRLDAIRYLMNQAGSGIIIHPACTSLIKELERFDDHPTWEDIIEEHRIKKMVEEVFE